MTKDTTATHSEILCKSLKETLTHSPTKKKKEEKKETLPQTRKKGEKRRHCHQQNNYNIQIIPPNPSKYQPEDQQYLSIREY